MTDTMRETKKSPETIKEDRCACMQETASREVQIQGTVKREAQMQRTAKQGQSTPNYKMTDAVGGGRPGMLRRTDVGWIGFQPFRG